MIDQCMMFHAHKRERENFEIYITDAAYVLTRLVNNKGAEIIPRYYDATHKQPEDNRTAEEITEDLVKRHGLVVM